MNAALLIIDVQNDFCSGGSLAVPDGDAVVPIINPLQSHFEHVVLTQDWHPKGHRSFASTHPGRTPFQTFELAYGPQILWPDHCVQGSKGAAFHPDLDTVSAELILRKGFRQNIDSYSAFFENDHLTPTGLAAYLHERGINTIYLAGLATDFCVKWSALDGLAQGFIVYVVEDAVRGIDADGSLGRAWQEMWEAGVQLVTSEHLAAEAQLI